MYAASDARIHDALDSFLEARQGARRFHGERIGRDVDPEHCFADWLDRTRQHDSAGIEKTYWSKVEKSALRESSGAHGGYVVPPDLSVALMRDLSTGSLFRKLGAYVHPMRSLTCDLPLPDVSTAPTAAGVAPYFGGFFMQIVTEGKKFPSTAGMQFRNVELNAWQLAGYVYASNPFLEDALGVEEWLIRLFGRGVGWYQDWYFFQGSGVGQPQGVINSGAAVTVTRTGTLVTDLQNMVSSLLPSAWESGAVWFCHPTALAKITGITGWFPNGELMLYGLPIVPTGKCSTQGTKGDIILAAPSLYVIGDRMQFEIAISREETTGYLANQSAIRVFSRFDGQPATAAPITLSDTSSTVSPFVVLV